MSAKELIEPGGVLITQRTREAIHEAAEAGYKIKFITLHEVTERDTVMNSARIRTILKDECIKTTETRRHIGREINIIGIEEF